MIKNIRITNRNGEILAINLSDVEPVTGLFVTEIKGLGPVKAAINMTDLATQDGAKYNSARAEKRNIVLSLRYLGKDAEQARLITYKYFPLKRQITFHVETETRKAEVLGYVESNEPNIFSQEAGAQISIVCDSAYFNDVGDFGIQELPFSDIVSLFEFEFSDDSSPSLEFSSIEIKRENVLTYNGETDNGILIKMYANGNFTNPIIYNNDTLEFLKIDTTKVEAIVGSSIKAGDEIRISTVRNDKYLVFVREGTTYNILNAMDINSTWFTLHPGDNIFSYTADTGELNIEFTVIAQVLFTGV